MIIYCNDFKTSIYLKSVCVISSISVPFFKNILQLNLILKNGYNILKIYYISNSVLKPQKKLQGSLIINV